MRWLAIMGVVASGLSGCVNLGANLAQGAPVTASSAHLSAAGERGASAITDGDSRTRWSSAYADRQWVMIDLRRPQQIGLITLVWETASARDFRAEASDDGMTWRAIGGATGAHGGPRVDQIATSGTARWIKIDLDRRATSWGFSLYEVMVFPRHR